MRLALHAAMQRPLLLYAAARGGHGSVLMCPAQRMRLALQAAMQRPVLLYDASRGCARLCAGVSCSMHASCTTSCHAAPFAAL
jgi:hypothetical protein